MKRTHRVGIAALLIVAAAAVLLFLMGRPLICTCGTVGLWVGEPNSSRTSQMLSDWYSLSHIVHGFLFFGVLWLVARRWPLERRFLIALIVETAWEVIENTPMVINRYREETAALGYNGDSVINSLSDIAMMALGFYLARRLSIRWSVALVLLMELVPLFVIRDNLTLNVWMLLAPNQAIKAWQSGGPFWPFH